MYFYALKKLNTKIMKRVIFTLATILCTLSASAQEEKSSPASEIKVYLSEFSTIHIDAPAKVELFEISEEMKPYIVYNCNGAPTDKFICEVDSKSGTLTIHERHDPKRHSITEAKVYYNSLTDINISKADVSICNTIDTELFDIYISNDAHLVAEVDVLDLKVTVAGKSLVILSGEARYHTLEISASECDATGLNTMSTVVDASHSAVAKVYAKERLEAKTATGSKVYYTADPQILRSEVTLFGGEVSKL